MKLYYAKGACCLAVRIVINELGLACDYEAVDLRAKVTESGQDYLKINPKGSVPTIVTDDHEVLTENAVIQQYLADKKHATNLLPPLGDFKRYRVLEWLNYVSTELHKTCGPLFNSNVPQEVKDNVFIPILKTKLNFVDQCLGQHKFLAGEHFTLPDGYLFVVLGWLAHFKINLADWANISRFYHEVHDRRAVQQALREEARVVTMVSPLK